MKRAKKCRLCDQETESSRHWYCAFHREVARRSRNGKRGRYSRAETTRRYGGEHQRLRRQWKPRVEAGGVVCWRCGRPILPGDKWDLGHHPAVRDLHAGPEHRRCNRRTATHKAQRRVVSRAW